MVDSSNVRWEAMRMHLEEVVAHTIELDKYLVKMFGMCVTVGQVIEALYMVEEIEGASRKLARRCRKLVMDRLEELSE